MLLRRLALLRPPRAGGAATPDESGTPGGAPEGPAPRTRPGARARDGSPPTAAPWAWAPRPDRPRPDRPGGTSARSGPTGTSGVRYPWLDERLPLPEARRALRGWRRTRPFWAGLLLVLGGTELLVVPLSPLTILVSLGLGGIAAIGIGLALVVAGLFLWVLPHTRHYVSLNALILSVLSFAATNLGGFLVGMALGIAGSAMGFGWTPKEQATGRATSVRTQRTLAAALPVALLIALDPRPPAQAQTQAPPSPAPPRAGAVTAPLVPPAVTTTRFAPHGFLLAGVTTVPTAQGPLKVMVLRMTSASLTDYRLKTRDGHDELALGADSLDLSGNVTLYLSKFSGCLEGLLCLTFDPTTLPVPPVVPPFVFMTRVTAEQALVTSDSIVANGLTLGAS
ncbi:DUF6114 domain-containing protein [Streptomyces sp. NBC_00083]|uniref:DUF6114 domain-containing protein n=1 Tax=Streptomyces sp. NBC_00083 TaxID=2975647 RepID=UPI00225185BB|nr:DUF6114 domain-containing protein [Streptomyces sp. NBC_00083]MCX5383629.1 DUF6114 domain-containing protein [Streptomyces sp. NBC_00083]